MKKYKLKKILKIFTAAILTVLCSAVIFSGCSGVDDGSLSTQSSVLAETVFTDEYKNLSDEEKPQWIENKLNELAEQKIIDGDSIKYYQDDELFLFDYADGRGAGISLKAYSDELNSRSSEQADVIDEENPKMASEDELNALVLNGFEDSRQDYYDSLKKLWDEQGLTTYLDNDVTVSDMKSIDNYDVVVISMHGGESDKTPFLSLEEAVTDKKSKKYNSDLQKKYIREVYCTDEKYHYWIYPEFFNAHYSKGQIKSKLIFSESCDFMGCDCYAEQNHDFRLANALAQASTATVIGYQNSVLAGYSRNVMKQTVDNMLLGYDANYALNDAKDIYGIDDNREVVSEHKYCAYPLICGDGSVTIVDVPVSDFSIDSEKTIALGQVDVIEPVFIPETANEYEITWSSSDESVALVSHDGIITPKKIGSTVITAVVTSKGNTITKSTELTVCSRGRDTVLVLDVSESMDGEPMNEMKKSAVNFCNDLLKNGDDNRVGIVLYDDYTDTVDLTDDIDYLISYIETIDDGGLTNMEGGLAAAESMLDTHSKPENTKNIVIMADGLPNSGNTSYSNSFNYSASYGNDAYANAVVDRANAVMAKYNLYSLGFFHDLSGESFDYANALMSYLTNAPDGYHQVELAEKLQFAFGDIQQTITDGSKIIINIACPVDVTVTYNNETLCSNERNFSNTASFGRLQILGRNRDIKVLALDPDNDYNIELTSTGVGTMNYSVNYFDDNDNIIDCREFENVPLMQNTVIKSGTDNSGDIDLNIDNDADGEVDEIWGAKKNSKAEIKKKAEPAATELETEENNNSIDTWQIILICCIAAVVLIIMIIIISITIKNDKKLNMQQSDIDSNDVKAEIRALKSPAIPQKPVGVPASPPAPVRQDIHTVEISFKGTDTVKCYPINPGQVYNIGKDPIWADITVPSDFDKVSRRHCTISYDINRSRFMVNDISKNGLRYADGKKLNKGINYMSNGVTVYLPDKACRIKFLK